MKLKCQQKFHSERDTEFVFHSNRCELHTDSSSFQEFQKQIQSQEDRRKVVFQELGSISYLSDKCA